jgi:hypothetical protein
LAARKIIDVNADLWSILIEFPVEYETPEPLAETPREVLFPLKEVVI